ncbi:MAG: efflux RND transporter periplasmic adaptor subunit [Planctomycetes bacterium]|nr:efflux RND transporter periplasmic adaptor subunit [Planctomycetota bacterium]
MLRLPRALVLLACTALPGCSDPPPTARGGRAPLPPRRVALVRARSAELPRMLALDGTLRADEVSTLGAVVSGRLKEMPVDLGTRIEAGATLAQLDPGPFQLRLAQARAAVSEARSILGLPLEGEDDQVDVEATSLVRQTRAMLQEAQANLERMRSSFDQGLIGASEYEPALAQAEVAAGKHEDALETMRTRLATLVRRRAELGVAERELRETTIVAPFGGSVLARLAAPGQYLTAGTPVVELVKTEPLRLVLEIPERESALVAVGQIVRFETEDASGEHTGRVVRLAPGLREASRTLRLEAEVSNTEHRLRPGAFVRARLELASEACVLVPASAVRRFAGVEKVAVSRDGKAQLLVVRSGRSLGDELEIRSGLDANAELVREIGDLVEGQPLELER